MSAGANIDGPTVTGFGEEWAAFDQTGLPPGELELLFERYFGIFPLDELKGAEGFDLGCGSGRWAQFVAPRVGKLHCIDPSPKALDVARQRLLDETNVEFHLAGAHDNPLGEASQDFGYSLGVLHHVPNAEEAMAQCVAKLRPGAPLLVYLYYRLDQRPGWFRALWKASDLARRVVSRLPFPFRKAAAEMFALTVYLPLSRSAYLAEKAGLDVSNWPLGYYRRYSYYTLRTDALDRFGTRLERRFSRDEIVAMMERCGLEEVRVSDDPPFWVAIGRRRKQS